MKKCNEKMMLKHLELVCGKGKKATLQIFPTKGEVCHIKPQVKHVTVSKKCIPELVEFSQTGANISVVPQKMDGKGRRAANVIGIKYLVIDLDKPTDVEAIKKLVIQPSIIVKSSPGRYHLYFEVKCKVENFTKNSKAISLALGADDNATDISRAFRLAGTINWKHGEPTVSQLVRGRVGERRKMSEIRKAFGVTLPIEAVKSKLTFDLSTGAHASVEKVKAALDAIRTDDRSVWLHIGMGLHSWNANEGRALWDKWARKSGKFDRADQERTWNGFTSGKGRTLGSVYYYANQTNGAKDHKASFPLEDDELAAYAAEKLRGQIRIDEEDEYYVFDQHHWRKDSKAAARRFMKVVEELKKIVDQAGTDYAKKRLKQQCGYVPAQRLLKGLHGFPDMDVKRDAFDSDPYLLGVKNGVVELRSGKFRAGKASDLIKTTANVEFDPDARCEAFGEFLKSIMVTKEYRRYFRQVCGYILTGDSSEQVAFIMLGSGSNGKGTLTRLTEAILGKGYCTTISPTFMKNATSGSANGPTPALMALRKARLIWCTETEHVGGVDKVFFKQLTGNDTLTGRHNYGEQESFRPQGKLILTTNVMPDWPHDDNALWRRVKVLPFKKSFTAESGRDCNLDQMLASEAAGVLNWMLIGAKEYLRDGFKEPLDVVDATAKARRESDSVNLWIKQECRPVKDRYLRGQEAYNAYVTFCKLRKIPPASMRNFKQSMERLGFISKRFDEGNRYLEITLLSK